MATKRLGDGDPDDPNGGCYWMAALPDGTYAHGMAYSRTEAEHLVDQYAQAAIRELRRRTPPGEP